jgi:hypothetical protein
MSVQFVLYVESVGYGIKEREDDEDNLFYSFNFSATIMISDNQGNLLTEPIFANFGENLNLYNKAIEAFMPLTLIPDQPFPIGEYTITCSITNSSPSSQELQN